MIVRRTKSLLKMSPGMIPRRDLLADLCRVVRETGCTTSTAYEEHGRFSYSTFKDRFGGWPHALAQAGLVPDLHHRPTMGQALSEQRVIKLGLHQVRTQRPCLRCEEPFLSSGKQNRLCASCLAMIECMGPMMRECG